MFIKQAGTNQQLCWDLMSVRPGITNCPVGDVFNRAARQQPMRCSTGLFFHGPLIYTIMGVVLGVLFRVQSMRLARDTRGPYYGPEGRTLPAYCLGKLKEPLWGIKKQNGQFGRGGCIVPTDLMTTLKVAELLCICQWHPQAKAIHRLG